MDKLEKLRCILVTVWLVSWIVMIVNEKTTILNLDGLQFVFIVAVFIVSLVITAPVQVILYIRNIEKIKEEENEEVDF